MSVTPDQPTQRDIALRALAAASPSARVRELLSALSDRFWRPVAVLYTTELGVPMEQAESRACALLKRLAEREADAEILTQCRGSLRRYLLHVARHDLRTAPTEEARKEYERAWVRCLLEETIASMEEEARLRGQTASCDAFMRLHVTAGPGVEPMPSALAEGRGAFWRALEVVTLGTLASEDSLVDELTELFGR